MLRGMVDHIDAHEGLARTLATLMADRSGALAEGSRALEQAVTDLVAAAVRDGTVRDDVDAGAVMMALHGIGAAHDRPGWRAEADDVITLVLDGLRRPHSAQAAVIRTTTRRRRTDRSRAMRGTTASCSSGAALTGVPVHLSTNQICMSNVAVRISCIGGLDGSDAVIPNSSRSSRTRLSFGSSPSST
ncbi:hypothetical protein Pma05_74750 [Plantactinospora mayteni]|uniref:Transcriptional regulator SbtR-like C-terminal domain-containing protein n=1 Tax=Plantactinospora mayteni TaxID=566021 RepID=A0ABQ4F205_9ACTN|nr:hypothetical protein Pma05_74750 [Plantactinospora mayteni]